MKLKLKKVKCLKCGFEWYPRIEDVRQCANPKCRTARWDVPPKTKEVQNATH